MSNEPLLDDQYSPPTEDCIPIPKGAVLSDGGDTPSQTIGRFSVRKLLGKGGFAYVYLCWDPQLEREVAIKLPRQSRMESARDRQLFVEEARKSAGLHHSGIVRVYDVDETGQVPFIVQEYFCGGTLDTLLRGEGLVVQRSIQMAIGVADALAAAHKHGVYHRDLKPSNILVDVNGEPHVSDFGLAVDESSQRDRAGEISGTIHYMSPEQLRGEAHLLDGRTDIWSLGVILYEMATRRRPFQGRTAGEVRAEILSRDPKPPRMVDASIPKELETIILRCLQKRATDRYSNATDLARELRSVGRRRQLAVWSAGVIIAVVFALLVASWATGIAGWQKAETQKPLPLRIEAFEIKNFRGEPAQFLGTVGKLALAARVNDNVRVTARFNEPAYCYLLALNPDGTMQACPRAASGMPPPATKEITYPSARDRYYGLTDGAGLQAFVLVASSKPLPAFDAWPHRSVLSWKPTKGVEGVWRFDGRQVEHFVSSVRGTERHVLTAPPPPMDTVCNGLRTLPGIDAVEAVAFPVEAFAASNGD